MSDPTITGTVHLIEPTRTFGQKGFRKRLVVVEQPGGRFTNYLPVEFVQDSCDDVDRLKTGDRVTISYRLTGRKWQKDERSEVKYFLSAEATGIQQLDAGAGAGAGAGGRAADEPPPGHFDDDESAPF